MKIYFKYFIAGSYWINIAATALLTLVFCIESYNISTDQQHTSVQFMVGTLIISLLLALAVVGLAIFLVALAMYFDHKGLAKEMGVTLEQIQVALFVFGWTVTYIKDNRASFSSLYHAASIKRLTS